MYTASKPKQKFYAYCKLPFLKTNRCMLAVKFYFQYSDLVYAWQIDCGENVKALPLAYLFCTLMPPNMVDRY